MTFSFISVNLLIKSEFGVAYCCDIRGAPPLNIKLHQGSEKNKSFLRKMRKIVIMHKISEKFKKYVAKFIFRV